MRAVQVFTQGTLQGGTSLECFTIVVKEFANIAHIDAQGAPGAEETRTSCGVTHFVHSQQVGIVIIVQKDLQVFLTDLKKEEVANSTVLTFETITLILFLGKGNGYPKKGKRVPQWQ